MSRWQRLKDWLNQYVPSKGVEVRILDLHNRRVVPEKMLEHLALKALVIETDERVVGSKGNSLAVTHAKHWIECVANSEHVQTRLLKEEGQDTFHILISKPEEVKA